MFAQVLSATLRILSFRAGPEDFPFDASRRLTAICLIFALLVNTLFVALLSPLIFAFVSAAMNVGLLALLTRSALAARKLDNRFQQTFNALLLTTSLLTLAMTPFWAQLAPILLEIARLASKNPDLLNHPEQWPQMSGLANFLLAALGFWQIAVIGHIFYRAAGGMALFMLIATVVLLLVLTNLSVGGPL